MTDTMGQRPPAKSRAITPMVLADVPEVAEIFYRAFRKPGQRPSAAFRDYFAQSFFGSPSYGPGQAGLVHRNADGDIDSALMVIPMQVSVHGRIITGRLMSNYMTDPHKRTRGGADMVLTIRARNQDLCFSDSANPISARHWKAVGGHILPIHSLDWRVVFRPAGWLAARAQAHLPPVLRQIATMLARPIGAILPRSRPAASPVNVEVMSRAAFIATAPQFVQRFAVHPVWAPDELGWLLDMAALNIVHGPLRLLAMRDDSGVLLGCCVLNADKGGTAHILNILSRAGDEDAVVSALLDYLDTMGCVAARGMAQPFLMETFGRRKDIAFVPRGACCISTRHNDIVAAAISGDIYLGGLMGEDWNRLVTDFY